jgi:hypothetical protein
MIFWHGSIAGYVAAVRQNAGKLAMIGETRALANCGYGAQFARLWTRPIF